MTGLSCKFATCYTSSHNDSLSTMSNQQLQQIETYRTLNGHMYCLRSATGGKGTSTCSLV